MPLAMNDSIILRSFRKVVIIPCPTMVSVYSSNVDGRASTYTCVDVRSATKERDDTSLRRYFFKSLLKSIFDVPLVTLWRLLVKATYSIEKPRE